MRRVSGEKGITTVRPLLGIAKQTIFDTAHALGVPYLKTTTLPDCERGRLRGVVLPFLSENLPVFIPGLERVSDQVRQRELALPIFVSYFFGGVWMEEGTIIREKY